VSEGWKPAKLGEFTEFRNGVNFGREDEGVGIPIVKVKDFGDLHDVPTEGLDQLDQARVQVPQNQFLKGNDILLVRSNGNPALVGRSMIYSGPDAAITFSGFAIRARVDQSQAVPAFVHYWLRSDVARSRFAREGNGTGIQNLSQGFLADLKINLPPLPEQRAIAATLGALDDKIELNRKMNATLEAMARALFRDWFVDFGPTRAKMEGRAPYLSPDLWPLFPDRLDAEGKPEGWDAVTLMEVCRSVNRGVTPKYDPGSGFWAINQKVNKGLSLEWQYAKELSIEAPISDAQIAQRWDVLVNCLGEGTIGRVHLFKETTGRFAVDQHMSICRGENDATGMYVYQVLSSPEGQAKIESLKSGSTGMSMLNISKLRDFDLLYPSRRALQAYRDLCVTLFDRLAHNERESHALAQTRDLLLPRLMSGELRVAEAERAVEAAL